jgi:hypothetical protein
MKQFKRLLSSCERIAFLDTHTRSIISDATDRVDATADFRRLHDAGAPMERGKDFGAWIFMATVILSIAVIAVLARNIFAAAHQLEQTKRNAEMVVRTLADMGATRKAGKTEIVACRLSEDAAKSTWGPCWSEILQGPDMSRLANVMQPANAVFGASCDGSEEAIGRIIIEKGTPWFSAGNTGTTYAPSDREDSIAAETPLRVQVCNRWSEPVKVQEIKF